MHHAMACWAHRCDAHNSLSVTLVLVVVPFRSVPAASTPAVLGYQHATMRVFCSVCASGAACARRHISEGEGRPLPGALVVIMQLP